MTCGIYEIRNIQTGDRYIGSSKRVEGRLNDHFKTLRRGVHHNDRLQKAWDQYGEAAFTAQLLEVCEANIRTNVEQVYLDRYRPAYNISSTTSWPPVELAPETRQKISMALVGRRRSAEHCAHISAAKKGKPGTNLGRIFSAEHRAKISAIHKGKAPWNKGQTCKPLSADHRAKISAAQKGKPKSRKPKFQELGVTQ